jgi:hypothetical protein
MSVFRVPQWGEPGGLRPKPNSRNRDHRMYIRMINPLYISPDEKVIRTREYMEEIASTSGDHRAAVQAATWLFNAEASVIQSAYTAHATEIGNTSEINAQDDESDETMSDESRV